MDKYAVLFVCMGNICRSPTAEGVFNKTAERKRITDVLLTVDSAGTIGYHAGENADPRAIDAAKKRGYDISQIISRQVNISDFEKFDLIIAMDKDNFANLTTLADKSHLTDAKSKIKLFLDYSTQGNYLEVPDPYYGGVQGFDLVIDLIEDASNGLLDSISHQLSKKH